MHYRKGAFTGATKDDPGFFGQARGGTLFLDEISELSLAMQAKLVRILNNGEYTPEGDTRARIADSRIMAVSKRPVRSLIASGRFREDFYHRLHVIAIEMPFLRQHKDDLGLITEHFLELLNPGEGMRQLFQARFLPG